VNKITQTTLSNGLGVILKEVHHAPVISWWVVYRTGSRNEPTGQTGISHWVEHMMFKGTEKFPAGFLDKAIDRVGGSWNAFTSMDYTMYHETLPAEHVKLAMEAEADRMVNAAFDPDETESERTVIISERQGRENSPVFWLREAMRGTAFRVHGYHHEIIGDLADLRTMTRDDLYRHYRLHYTPTNATVIAVGAFDTSEMLQQIESIYGTLPTEPEPTLFTREEPQQLGERRIEVQRPGNTAFLQIAHHVPQATHEDWFALDILDSILSGPGGNIDNKTSRLYQALVKTGISAGVGGGMSQTIDPYLYTLTSVANEGRGLDEAEQALTHEIERIQQEGVTEYELQRAKKQARAAFAYESESLKDQAYWLGMSWILGDTSWSANYLDRIGQITLDDIQRVAQTYLIPKRRITGLLIPTQEGGIS